MNLVVQVGTILDIWRTVCNNNEERMDQIEVHLSGCAVRVGGADECVEGRKATGWEAESI